MLYEETVLADAKKRKFDILFMDVARRVAEMSYAERNKVGTVIVKNGNIISFGWNGTPNGFPNRCETDDNRTKDEVIHAEPNAIAKLARSSGNGDGATMYVTLSPCTNCAKLVIQSGFERVVYFEQYRDVAGIEMLRTANISVDHLTY